jgi:uncharacterized protein YhdP
MNFDTVKGKVNWSLKNKQWLIGLDDLAVANKDLSLNTKGSYLIGKEKNPDSMDLAIQFDRAEIQTIFRYLPSEMSKDARSYIEKAVVGGQIKNGSLKIKGDPNKAPFETPNSGELTLTLPITKVVYRPAPYFLQIKGLGQNLLISKVKSPCSRLNLLRTSRVLATRDCKYKTSMLKLQTSQASKQTFS